MRNINGLTLRELDIYRKQHVNKVWLTTVTLEQARQIIDLVGESRIEFRFGRVFKGFLIVDVYLKGYTLA